MLGGLGFLGLMDVIWGKYGLSIGAMGVCLFVGWQSGVSAKAREELEGEWAAAGGTPVGIPGALRLSGGGGGHHRPRRDGRRQLLIRLIALTGVVCVSFSAIFVRLADVTPTTSAFLPDGLRPAIPGHPVAHPAPDLTAPPHHGRGARRSWPAFFLGLDLAFWHRAIEAIGAGLATVLGNTQVIFVALFGWWIFGERPGRAARLGIPVVFGGVVLISGVGQSAAYGADPRAGAVLGLLTGDHLCRLSSGLPPAPDAISGSPAGPLLDVTLGAAAAVGVLGLVDGRLNLALAWPAHGWLLALALGSQVVGWQLIGAALPRLPALESSILLLLQPVLTMLWASILFGEAISSLQYAGMVLVLAGVSWMSLRRQRRRGSRRLPRLTCGRASL